MMSSSFLISLLVSCASEEAVKVYNSSPTVVITSHSNNETFQDGYEITFQAQVQDDNHESSTLSIQWSSDVRTLCPAQVPTSDGISQCSVVLEEGESIVRVQVTDPEDAAAIAEVTVNVEPTFAPTVQIQSPTAQGLYYSDQLILFSAIIEDSEDASSELTYSWSSSLDGVLPSSAIANEDGLLEEYMYLTEGTHALTLSVTDRSGKSTERSISFSVGGTNTNPACEIVSPVAGDAYLVGDSITFQATMSDQEIDVDELMVTWISDKDGDIGTGLVDSSGEITLSTNGLTANNHIIQLVVRDELDSTCSDSITISVGTPPELTLSSPLDGDVVVAGDVVRFEGMVQDNEENASALILSWTSDIDGVFSAQGANSFGEVAFNTSSLSAGLHSISVIATDSSGFTDSVLMLLRVNQLPSTPLLSVSPDPAYTQNDLIAAASGSTDADGDSVSYTYQWYQNGSITTHTGVFVPNTDTSKNELWSVRATPTDGFQAGDYTEVSIQISNTAPIIDTLSASQSQAYASDVLTCTGVSSDADGDPISEGYIWMNETTGIPLGSSASVSLSPLSVSPGDSISCTYSATDGVDGVGQEEIVVILNTEPVVDSLAIVPSTPYLGDTLSCIGSVHDDDLEIITESYLWKNQTTGSTLSTGSSLLLDANQVHPNDVISCTLSVTDSSGGSASSSSTATVGNLAPTIDSISFDLSSLAIGDTATCISSESDPEGDIPSVSYIWTNETNGVQIGTGASLTITSSMATGLDQISCTATATDSYGATDIESVSIFVDETIPEFGAAASVSPSVGVTTSSSLSCSGVASDPDGTSISYEYVWSVGTTILGSNASITLSPASVQPTDVVTCTITATDGAGEQATSAASVMLDNTAPVLSGATITPNVGVDSSTVLSCTVNVADADLENLTPTYAWSHDGVLLGSGSSLNLTPNLIEPGDEVLCTASVTDGYGATATDVHAVSVENTVPVIDSLNITPTLSYNDGTLTCVVGATDADNQTLSTTYEWSNDTQGVTLGTSSSLTLDSNTADRGDIITCSVVVLDTSGDSVSDMVSLTLGNRAPGAPSVAIAPSSAYIDSTLSCTPSASIDPDGDGVSYTYSWTVNGGPVVGTSSTKSSAFVAGDSVLCTVTPSDGLLDGNTASQSIIILNSPPVVSDVSLSPTTAYTDDELTATPTVTDLDNDSVSSTYTWTVNGTEVQSGSLATLSGGLFDKDDIVAVSVVAFDGTDSSTAALASVTIMNSAPTSPEISLIPLIPVEELDDLVCTVITASSDDDGDTVYYSFGWTVDGTVYTSAVDDATSSTILATETTASEEWACTVTPNDVDEDGTSVSSSVVVDSGWDGEITFTTCGHIGQAGPSQSQCEGEYSGTLLDGLVTLSSGIQQWEVPSDGTYQIEAQGAAGGGMSGHASPGKGARMIGSFELVEGQLLNIVVGQHAYQNRSTSDNGTNSGGGGGTFVWIDGESTPILVAGGGGGVSAVSTVSSNVDASTGISGNPGTNANGSTIGNAGGSNGGIGAMTYSYSAGAGAGWNTGAPSPSHSSCSYRPTHGGGFSGGFLGGDGGSGGQGCGSLCESMSGGFGGGGGASGACTTSGSGGGGGYSGGGVGNDCCSSSGGGGGSYNVGGDQSNSAGYNSGHGTVIVDKL